MASLLPDNQLEARLSRLRDLNRFENYAERSIPLLGIPDGTNQYKTHCTSALMALGEPDSFSDGHLMIEPMESTVAGLINTTGRRLHTWFVVSHSLPRLAGERQIDIWMLVADYADGWRGKILHHLLP